MKYQVEEVDSENCQLYHVSKNTRSSPIAGDAVKQAKKKYGDENGVDYRDLVGRKIDRIRGDVFVFVAEKYGDRGLIHE